MTHLLVTNDFPPKVGGIQNYLFDLWSRLDPERFVVLTTKYPGAAAFDAAQPFRVVRSASSVLLPTPALRSQIDELATEIDASLVLLDPALPLGAIGRFLMHPYGLVLHGAEVTVPARLPLSSSLLASVIRRAKLVVAAGGYPAGEARHLLRQAMPPVAIVPPSIDTTRFRPIAADERAATRRELGIADDARLVVSVSRLVPRKGMDVLIEAAAKLVEKYPDLQVLIGGAGRDDKRLSGLIARHHAPVRLIGRVPDDLLPHLYGAADVAAMLCRNRWGGLEQEGFGIVFLESGACGVATLAGASGGADEAVINERTGLVADRPADLHVATEALDRLLADQALRARLGAAARERAVAEFDHAVVVKSLSEALAAHGG